MDTISLASYVGPKQRTINILKLLTGIIALASLIGYFFFGQIVLILGTAFISLGILEICIRALQKRYFEEGSKKLVLVQLWMLVLGGFLLVNY